MAAVTGNSGVCKKSFNGTCTVGKRARGSIASKAEAYLQAVNVSLGAMPKVTNAVSKRQPSGLPRLDVVTRVSHIPIVESGIEVTEKLYSRIRDSNPVIRWYLGLYEKSLATGVQLATPAVQLLETPLQQLDKFLCLSLDAVERRVPSINLPPQTMLTETRRFVIRRAGSVRELGAAVLDSRVTAATAGVLDRALTTADQYVDRILPPDASDVTSADVVDGECSDGECSGRAKAAQAVQHGKRLKRKLQRRLTRQALAEAKAIKEQIHVLLYVAELVATDPALAWQKAKELYSSLSQPEPENQARPATLEQLLVLLTRETARKMVHLINYTHTELPKNVRQAMEIISNGLASAADALLKTVPVETALAELRSWRSKLEALLLQLQAASKTYLEHFAVFLAGNEEREKITPRPARDNCNEISSINGVMS